MASRNYRETLQYMFEQLPMYQRVGSIAIKKDLGNIQELCNYLGNPERQLKCIHVAGTNGKGSTCHILSSLLQSHGFKVGVYTSPHYKSFRERIKINQNFISTSFVTHFIAKHQVIIEKIKPSFFEMTVALAFQYFAEKKVDYAIIEVGLGGRLDSTNIILPIVSVITNISLDHTQMLGNTLVEIAREKAGIIKPNTPVVIGEYQEDINEVFRQIAKQNNAPLEFAQDSLKLEEKGDTIQIESPLVNFSFSPDWWSSFQAKNCQTALAAYFEFCQHEKLPIHKDKIVAALEKMPQISYFIGRWQSLSTEPKIIADSAHNAAGLAIVMEKINNLEFEKLHLVLGFSDDKDLTTVWDYFPRDAQYYWAKANVPRGLNAQILREKALQTGRKGRSYSTVKNALKAAKRAANPKDLIYVGGSIFVVAEVL